MTSEVKVGATEVPMKVGYNPKTRLFHKVKFAGRFYVANCEPGTVLTIFDDIDAAMIQRNPCLKCWRV